MCLPLVSIASALDAQDSKLMLHAVAVASPFIALTVFTSSKVTLSPGSGLISYGSNSQSTPGGTLTDLTDGTSSKYVTQATECNVSLDGLGYFFLNNKYHPFLVMPR